MLPKKYRARQAPSKQADLSPPTEQRDFTLAVFDPSLPFLRPSTAGVPVTTTTSLGIAAFNQGVRLISENIAKTELFPARREERGGWTPATDHPTYDLLRHAPNDYQTSFSFWATLLTHAVVAGFGVAEIKRSGGRVTGLHLLDPSFKPAVHDNRLIFQSGSTTFDAANLICIRGLSWTGLDAFSPVALANDMLGTRIAEARYQASMLGNGANANGHLEIPGNTNEQQRAQIRKGWNEQHQGSDNAGNLGLLWGGAKFVQTSYSPADAMVIESQNFGVAEVSRLLGIPGWMLGAPDAIKPSSTEEGMALFVALTLSPWFRQIQQELDLKLLSRDERRSLFYWHDTRNLTQGDSRSQVDEADKLIKIGVYSVNEGRLSLGMNPIDDERFNWHLIPVNNLQALETINPADPAPTQPAVNQPHPLHPDESKARAMRAMIADPFRRLAKVEATELRRLAKKDRFDVAATEHSARHAQKLAEALTPAIEVANAVLGLGLDAREIASDQSSQSLDELRSLWTTYDPASLPGKLETLIESWEGRAQALAERLLDPTHPPAPK